MITINSLKGFEMLYIINFRQNQKPDLLKYRSLDLTEDLNSQTNYFLKECCKILKNLKF